MKFFSAKFGSQAKFWIRDLVKLLSDPNHPGCYCPGVFFFVSFTPCSMTGAHAHLLGLDNGLLLNHPQPIHGHLLHHSNDLGGALPERVIRVALQNTVMSLWTPLCRPQKPLCHQDLGLKLHSPKLKQEECASSSLLELLWDTAGVLQRMEMQDSSSLKLCLSHIPVTPKHGNQARAIHMHQLHVASPICFQELPVQAYQERE